MEKYTIYRSGITIGMLILLSGILLEILTSIDDSITIFLTNAGIIVMLGSYYKLHYRESTMSIQDEWTRKVGRTGLAYSWIVTFMVMIGLFWINHFGWFQMSVNEVLGIIFFTMIISANLFQFYFKRRGDVE